MMTRTLFSRWLPRRRPLPQLPTPGLFHYQREIDGQSSRFHLRVDAGGGGILLANATCAARLNPSGVLIAKLLFDGKATDEVVQHVRETFRNANENVVRRDVEKVQRLITDLEAPGDNFPILNLADAAFDDEPSLFTLPLSADIPLGSADQMVRLLDRLWSVGIPHVTLMAPENLDAAVLVRAVERAEDLGMIAGVRGRATDLDHDSLLENLAQAGVDHVNVPYLSAKAEIHDRFLGTQDLPRAEKVFERLLQLEVCPVAEISLVEPTLDDVAATLHRLADRGVHNVGFFAIAAGEELSAAARDGSLLPGALVQAADLVEELSLEASVRFLWYAPATRDPRQTLSAQARGGPRCSGDHAVRIEPDGAVIPARGAWRTAGNLLAHDWQTIQNHPVWRTYRERVLSPTHCDTCPGLAICAADCPRSPLGWSDDRERHILDAGRAR